MRRIPLSRPFVLAVLAVVAAAVGCAHPEQVTWKPPPIPPRPTWARTKAEPTPAATPVPAASGALAIHRRNEWANAAPIASLLDPMGTAGCITVHHEGNHASAMSDAAVCTHLRAIRTHQIKTKSSGGLGAGDIAYHFLIDPNGGVWEGRPIRYQGAHAGNGTANRANIGICLFGDFNSQQVPWAQKDSLRKLLIMLMRKYGIPPGRMYTHREVKVKFGLPPTQCPGRHLQEYMNSLRTKLKTGN